MTFVAVEAAGHMVHGALGPATSGEGGSIIFMHDIVLKIFQHVHLKSIPPIYLVSNATVTLV